jgi:hypothetical protein
MNKQESQAALNKEITRRCAAKIRAAHEQADTLLAAFRFLEKEVLDGASIEQAVHTMAEVYPDPELNREIDEVMEAVAGF